MVRKELFAKTGNEWELIDNALMDFIQLSEINPLDETTKSILEGLDEGERQAIGIALSIRNDAILLIDDQAGRQSAEKLNIKITGLGGVGCFGAVCYGGIKSDNSMSGSQRYATPKDISTIGETWYAKIK